VLAGFPDGLADEGPAAGPASLAGLRIARERGWTAPDADHGPQAVEQPATEQGAVATADTSRAESETRVAEASEPGTEGTPKEADK
jgi:NADH-quinone oxidoreductase subunit E